MTGLSVIVLLPTGQVNWFSIIFTLLVNEKFNPAVN